MPLVSFTVVAPGSVKDTPLTRALYLRGKEEILGHVGGTEQWPIWHVEEYHGPTGSEMMVLVDAAPGDLKRSLVALEDGNPWGRLWDIDVVVESGPIPRTAIGAPARTCLMCDRPSTECARSRRHSVEALLAHMGDVVGPVLPILAAEALRMEAELTPKPGLVDEADPGAHDDMDISTFRESATALEDYFVEVERLGTDLPALREAGLRAEQSMYAATGGVNTHKGAIYSLGLLVATGADLTTAADLAARTLGEQTRVPGRGGARAEAADGFPHALIGLAEYERTGSWHRALVAIMAVLEDSNLLARGGVEALTSVQSWASDLLAADVDGEAFLAELARANRRFIRENWSPGGAADLLAVAMFLHLTR